MSAARASTERTRRSCSYGGLHQQAEQEPGRGHRQDGFLGGPSGSDSSQYGSAPAVAGGQRSRSQRATASLPYRCVPAFVRSGAYDTEA
ncbi:hypothetical protein [Streptomyces sp. NPDC088760]|uniref:hypothetical protein n=1 Tax=Streptomyces sp. NPDC088760 TaxID=3365890 RepID=UPI0038069EC7